MEQPTLFERVTELHNVLVTRANGYIRDEKTEKTYTDLRSDLVTLPDIKARLPDFVIKCRDLQQFWDFIKPKLGTYKERRTFLSEAFSELLSHLENVNASPFDTQASAIIHSFEPENIHSAWQKALDRRDTDPDGAITMARTLLESVCKHILDDAQVSYNNEGDLPMLYKAVSQKLNLAPSQHTEEIFKQILGGCKSVVEGLGAVRNKLGDAHGTGKSAPRPMERHAELAVNLAGTMATFLIRTYLETRS